MATDNLSAEEYRAKAKELREVAATMSSKEAKASVLNLANDCERVATATETLMRVRQQRKA